MGLDLPEDPVAGALVAVSAYFFASASMKALGLRGAMRLFSKAFPARYAKPGTVVLIAGEYGLASMPLWPHPARAYGSAAAIVMLVALTALGLRMIRVVGRCGCHGDYRPASSDRAAGTRLVARNGALAAVLALTATVLHVPVRELLEGGVPLVAIAGLAALTVAIGGSLTGRGGATQRWAYRTFQGGI